MKRNNLVLKHMSYQNKFQILPAIDIKDGKCVRLLQGKFDNATEYPHDPVSQAQLFEDQGAQYLHVVDLDGALEGNPINTNIIANIVEAVSCKVEVSGGIRSKEDVQLYKQMNPWQIILGSMAVFDQEFVQIIVSEYGSEGISVALDSKNGYAASRGWVDTSKHKIENLAQKLKEIGITRFICTDVRKDGMMQGVNIVLPKKIKEITGANVVASGGVRNVEDVRGVKQAGLDGVVIGKAIYDNTITLEMVLND